MASSVPIIEKKTFIRWFLKNFQLKKREGVWILNYLLTEDALLKNVRFVEDAHYSERGIIMSSVDHDGVPFRYYRGKMMTQDAEKCFHDLRLNHKGEFFIQINFPNAYSYINYIAVVERNPYLPNELPKNLHDELTMLQVVENSLYVQQETKLLQQIDEALDSGDKESFFQLSKTLETLRKKSK